MDLLRVLVCLEPDNSPRAAGLYGFPPMKEKREISDRERQIASTVIQWLGSNIGMSFLECALQRCGRKITDTGLQGDQPIPAAGKEATK